MRYSEEVKQFIKDNVVGTRIKDLIDMVNSKYGTEFTDNKMRSYMKNHNLKNGMSTGLPAGRPTELFPQDIRDYIKENHVGVGPKEMTKRLNDRFATRYKVAQLTSYYRNHKVSSGLDGKFENGHKPWNKGLKGLDIGGKDTRFKKGHIPTKYRPVGSERINVDGYYEVKIADPNKWEYKHRIVWKQHNGPVPSGYVVIFADRDRRNFDINNLVLVSRRQLAMLNKHNLIKSDAELTKTGVIIADLELRIREVRK